MRRAIFLGLVLSAGVACSDPNRRTPEAPDLPVPVPGIGEPAVRANPAASVAVAPAASPVPQIVLDAGTLNDAPTPTPIDGMP